VCSKKGELLGIFYLIKQAGRYVPVFEEDLELENVVARVSCQFPGDAVSRTIDLMSRMGRLLTVRKYFGNQGQYREALWRYFKLNYISNGNWLLIQDVLDAVHRQGKHVPLVEGEIGAMYIASGSMEKGNILLKRWESLYTRWSPLNAT